MSFAINLWQNDDAMRSSDELLFSSFLIFCTQCCFLNLQELGRNPRIVGILWEISKMSVFEHVNAEKQVEISF